MFAYGITQKIIAEFTGHNSSKALQVYERTTTEQLKTAGLAISNQEESMQTAKVPDHEPDVKLDLDKAKNLPTFSGTRVAAQSTLTCDFSIQDLP